ncbi:MAG: S-layer homology domain-containing protein [Candidatus Gracilibacteria bacterium]|jgi:hypothetical protein
MAIKKTSKKGKNSKQAVSTKVKAKNKIIFKKEPLADVKAVEPEKRLTGKNLNFLIILFLFAGVSLYAISSFYFSTNSYLKSMYASVVGEEEDVIPDSCKPCTDAPECEQFCKVEPYEIFRDVTSDMVAADKVEALKDAGIIKGFDDGTFQPDQKITRAESLVILTNALDADYAGGTYANCFNDVMDQWFAVYVCYAKENGLITGYADGTYQPNMFLKKAEALKVLMSAFEYDLPEKLETAPFEDVSVDAWFAPYAAVAKENGIVKTADFFNPGYELTRMDYVVMVYNAMKDKEEL